MTPSKSPRVQLLFDRMQAIASALQPSEGALALLATGSAGLNIDNVDAFSDLDLMIVTTGGIGEELLQNLDWLEEISPIVFRFRYNDDCYKLFFEDRVFCELSIIDISQLPALHYSGSTVIWCRPTFDQRYCASHGPEAHDAQWVLDELLTILYTGLCKYRRGEFLSATGYLEGQVRELLARLVTLTEQRVPGIFEDAFAKERRFELAYPSLVEWLPSFCQGYSLLAQSAKALMEFLESRYTLNPIITREIHTLLDQSDR